MPTTDPVPLADFQAILTLNIISGCSIWKTGRGPYKVMVPFIMMCSKVTFTVTVVTILTSIEVTLIMGLIMVEVILVVHIVIYTVEAEICTLYNSSSNNRGSKSTHTNSSHNNGLRTKGAYTHSGSSTAPHPLSSKADTLRASPRSVHFNSRIDDHQDSNQRQAIKGAHPSIQSPMYNGPKRPASSAQDTNAPSTMTSRTRSGRPLIIHSSQSEVNIFFYRCIRKLWTTATRR